MGQKILYKRTATGATQMWWMEREGNKYRALSGQVGGAVTTSEWTVVKGKNIGRSNETSPEKQAELEVEAKYTLQRKKGYRDSVEAAQESERFQCMLATKFDERRDKVLDKNGKVLQYDPQRDHMPSVYVQPKLDGLRCIATKDGLWSRQGNRIVAAPHIEAALAPIFSERPDLILDGELYNHFLKEDFNKIVSLVKKLKPTAEDLQASAEMIQYWVYDGLVEDRDARFYIRFHEDIAPLIDGMKHASFCAVPTNLCNDLQQIDACYEDWLLDGYEGMMIRLDLPYEQKRSSTLMKRKEFQDAEFVLVGVEEGVGNAAGMAKVAHLLLKTGKVFKADIVGDRDQLRAMLKKVPSVLRKKTTIVFQNYTPDGVPRFGKLKVEHQEWWNNGK